MYNEFDPVPLKFAEIHGIDRAAAALLLNLVEEAADNHVEAERSCLLGRTEADIAHALACPWMCDCPDDCAIDWLGQSGIQDPDPDLVAAVVGYEQACCEAQWSRLDLGDFFDSEDENEPKG